MPKGEGDWHDETVVSGVYFSRWRAICRARYNKGGLFFICAFFFYEQITFAKYTLSHKCVRARAETDRRRKRRRRKKKKIYRRREESEGKTLAAGRAPERRN